jgi:hypothetical protein
LETRRIALTLCACADALIGVTLYGDIFPQSFGKFDRSAVHESRSIDKRRYVQNMKVVVQGGFTCALTRPFSLLHRGTGAS